MKVLVVGNGLTWTKRPNTNFILNDEILIDTPQGSIKAMKDIIDYEKIKYILITHFHSDHFTDIHIIVDIINKRNNKEKVSIIAPKSFFKRLKNIMKSLEVKSHINYLKNHFNVIELKGNEKLKLDKYIFESFTVIHKVSIALGYSITDTTENKTVGFSGDTCMCEGLEKIIDKSSTIFIECSCTQKSNKHLSVQENINLRQKYKNKNFYSIHVTDDILKNYKEILSIPECNENIII